MICARTQRSASGLIAVGGGGTAFDSAKQRVGLLKNASTHHAEALRAAKEATSWQERRVAEGVGRKGWMRRNTPSGRRGRGACGAAMSASSKLRCTRTVGARRQLRSLWSWSARRANILAVARFGCASREEEHHALKRALVKRLGSVPPSYCSQQHAATDGVN